jgi:predicted amidophosphoribosyltransferase
MGRVRCPDCGHGVSNSAEYCPNCGCDDDRIKRAHPWHGRTIGEKFRMVAGGLVFLVFLFWILF